MREWIALHQEVSKILCESLPMNLVLKKHVRSDVFIEIWLNPWKDLPVSYRETCCQLDVEGLT